MNKPSLTMLLGILFCMMFAYKTVHAVDRAYFTADKTTLLVGEPVQVVLHLHIPQQAKLVLPDFKNWKSPFYIKQVGSLSTSGQAKDDNVQYELPLTLILWQTGQFLTPPLEVVYQLNGATINLPVESLQFIVPSVLDASDLSLRPFKAQINLPYFPVWIVILGMIISVVVIFGAVRFGPFRKPRLHILNPIDNKWHPDANAALNTLRQIGQSQVDPPAIYVQVSDCLRRYLDARFAVHSVDLTTSELLDRLEENGLINTDDQHKLVEMLKRADLVKFARAVPKLNAAQQYVSVAAQWIQAVEQTRGGSPL